MGRPRACKRYQAIRFHSFQRRLTRSQFRAILDW
jgi:hypothetical protein